MRTRFRTGRALALALLLASCSGGTAVDSVWKDPTVIGHRENLLVVGIGENETARRMFEDNFVEILEKNGNRASQSYPFLPQGDQANRDRIRDLVNEKGFDGILTARAVSVDREETFVPATVYYTPPSWYYSYWDFIPPASTAVQTPGYYEEETRVRVESNLYDPGGSLLCSAATSTLKTDNMKESIRGFSKTLAGELQKAGMVH